MNIALLHPDLGIGGAERLIIDVGLALKSKGHRIRIITSHHDENHCFPETKDGTLDVTVVGNWLPRCIFGRFHAVFAYLRMLYAACYVILNEPFDIVICDQVSVCIPVLRLKSNKVIFYCHYPDLLLTARKSWLKWLYRMPLDWLEEKTTGMANVIIVNSNFTAQVFRKTFKSLSGLKLVVVHPTIKFTPCGKLLDKTETDKTYFLSINRFERKKNIELALLAFCKLKEIMPQREDIKPHLIIAGGYDDRITENKEYFLELVQLADSCGIQNEVSFLKSPNDGEKQNLFHISTAVLYTPENEHFGIVPLEAMYLSRPVIACNSGGPLETVVDGKTGYLCDSTPEAFAERMKLICLNKHIADNLGCAGAKHVHKNFSFHAFQESLHKIINSIG